MMIVVCKDSDKVLYMKEDSCKFLSVATLLKKCWKLQVCSV